MFIFAQESELVLMVKLHSVFVAGVGNRVSRLVTPQAQPSVSLQMFLGSANTPLKAQYITMLHLKDSHIDARHQ
jgi:hypothetical protein